ncbi:MAG TPA: vanillate O-demethylase oxidoreductase VanB [Holophagaceae bacterium]|nr:vanillate O-demethylase oxidoreductase VanB [Holophagaceae bacterium]
MNASGTDRIEKQILLRAPRARVWRALTDAGEFGEWFRVKLDGPFVPGGRTTGHITYPGYEHLRMDVLVERMEAETLFGFRWHPAAVDPGVDYSREPSTLVEFHLEAVTGGTLLRLVESGFDQLPADRREAAYRQNEGGWAIQMDNIQRHVAG